MVGPENRAFADEASAGTGFVSGMNAADGTVGNSSAPGPTPWPTSSATERDGHTPRRLSPHGLILSSDQTYLPIRYNRVPEGITSEKT